MKEALFFGLVIVLSILVGAVSNEIGVTQEKTLCGNDPFSVESCVETPEDPGGSNFFDRVMAPFGYVFDAVAAFFKIITYQVEGVNPLISTMMLVPISTATVWLVLRLIRGGG